MFKCHVCGSEQGKAEKVVQIFFIDDKPMIVEDVPATVCSRCGEAILDISTVEKIRQMAYGNTRPIRSIMADVFEFPQCPENNHATPAA